jgi:hypothetical protein
MASNFTYSIVKAPVVPIFSGNLCIAAGIAAGKLNYSIVYVKDLICCLSFIQAPKHRDISYLLEQFPAKLFCNYFEHSVFWVFHKWKKVMAFPNDLLQKSGAICHDKEHLSTRPVKLLCQVFLCMYIILCILLASSNHRY